MTKKKKNKVRTSRILRNLTMQSHLQVLNKTWKQKNNKATKICSKFQMFHPKRALRKRETKNLKSLRKMKKDSAKKPLVK
jgi:hypothetical protein